MYTVKEKRLYVPKPILFSMGRSPKTGRELEPERGNTGPTVFSVVSDAGSKVYHYLYTDLRDCND